MLTPPELKITLETLSKRRSWLRKTLEDANLEPEARAEHIKTFKMLDSAMQKLAKSSPVKPAMTASIPAQKTKKTKVTFTNARVLIAEDNPDASALLVDILSEMGFKLIDTAEDGMQAFDKIKSNDDGYDVILCDWDMPEVSGLEVHQKAKDSNTLRQAHFVMVTAVSDSKRIKKAIVQGVSDYIIKPVDMGILEGKLKTALGIEEK